VGVSAEERRAGLGQDLVLLQGLRDTRGALRRFSQHPGRVVGPWFAGSFAIAVTLLCAVWLISLPIAPDLTTIAIPGVADPVDLGDFLSILSNNLLVLALHAAACVAGFIAGASLPLAARGMTGMNRRIHEKAGPIAISWVVLVTTFSLFAQAFALGFHGATLAHQFGISTFVLILTALPHALLELTAVFLPLAAWLIASRRDEWQDLLAATLLTVALALPMLVAAALIELYLWPELLRDVSPFPPQLF
jgi:hypothetical protein